MQTATEDGLAIQQRAGTTSTTSPGSGKRHGRDRSAASFLDAPTNTSRPNWYDISADMEDNNDEEPSPAAVRLPSIPARRNGRCRETALTPSTNMMAPSRRRSRTITRMDDR